MARIPRKYLIETSDVGVYHCINRCVRRAFLCGTDGVSGKCFDHRKEWIQGRLEFLAGEFGIDVMAFAVMSNHLHVVVRNRPDVVEKWSDEEVARRWWRLFPGRREADGSAAEPTEADLLFTTGRAERLAEVRSRLSSVSWFMRCLAEPIARQANREDECSGRFWEGRYRCQPLLDESAMLACMAYVDLNPIRAKIAATPETSRFTSVFERLRSAREAVTEVASSDQPATTVDEPIASIAANGRDESLTSSSDSRAMAVKGMSVERKPLIGGSVTDQRLVADQPVKPVPSSSGERRSGEWLSPLPLAREVADEFATIPHRRASNKGCLPMTLVEYLALLDWTGRQLRRDKRGAIPSSIAPVLERLKISEEGWPQLVRNFSRMFQRAAGTPATLATEATRRGRHWVKGINSSRATFA